VPGTGYCVRIASDVFELRGGIAVVRDFDASEPDVAERIEEAESLCPSGAIHL
jgi:ferredoxin